MSGTPRRDDRKGHHYYTRIGRRFARLNCDALRARPYIVVMTLAVIMRLGAGHHAAWCRSSCGLVPLIMPSFQDVALGHGAKVFLEPRREGALTQVGFFLAQPEKG